MSGTNGPTYTDIEIINFQREWGEQKRKCLVENALLTAINKRARDAGLPVEVIHLTERLRKRGILEAQSFHEHQTRIMMANGLVLGPQLSAFAAMGYQASDEVALAARINAAEDQGFRAGRGGLGKDANPHDIGTEESQAWVKWWQRGVAAQEHITGARGTVAQANKAQPKRRGRTPKALPAPDGVVVPMKRRGRPPKAARSA